MKVIHKFGPLNPHGVMGVYGRPVHVDKQDEFGGEQVYMWCEVDQSQVNCYVTTHMVRYVPTGFQNYGYDEEYFGTVVMSSGLVWHVLTEKVNS